MDVVFPFQVTPNGLLLSKLLLVDPRSATSAAFKEELHYVLSGILEASGCCLSAAGLCRGPDCAQKGFGEALESEKSVHALRRKLQVHRSASARKHSSYYYRVRSSNQSLTMNRLRADHHLLRQPTAEGYGLPTVGEEISLKFPMKSAPCPLPPAKVLASASPDSALQLIGVSARGATSCPGGGRRTEENETNQRPTQPDVLRSKCQGDLIRVDTRHETQDKEVQR